MSATVQASWAVASALAFAAMSAASAANHSTIDEAPAAERRRCIGQSGVDSRRRVASAHAPIASAPSRLRQKTSSNSP